MNPQYIVNSQDFEGKWTGRAFGTKQQVWDYITSLDAVQALDITSEHGQVEQAGAVLQLDELEAWMSEGE